MKAYLINPAAHTITEFDFSGKRPDMCAMLGCDDDDLRGVSLDEEMDSPDVLFVAYRPACQSFFMTSALPIPLAGLGIVVGMQRMETDEEKGLDGGHAGAPMHSLEWLKKNLLWMERAGPDSFMCDGKHTDEATAMNVIAGLKALAEKHSDSLTVEQRYLN